MENFVAHTTYQRQLGYGRGHRITYRRASRPIGDLVRVGSIVQTSWGSSYAVVAIIADEDRPPQGGWFPFYDFVGQRLRDGVVDHSFKGRGWFGEYVPYGRRLLHLFEHNDDELVVIGFDAETARQYAPQPVQLDLFGEVA